MNTATETPTRRRHRGQNGTAEPTPEQARFAKRSAAAHQAWATRRRMAAEAAETGKVVEPDWLSDEDAILVGRRVGRIFLELQEIRRILKRAAKKKKSRKKN